MLIKNNPPKRVIKNNPGSVPAAISLEIGPIIFQIKKVLPSVHWLQAHLLGLLSNEMGNH